MVWLLRLTAFGLLIITSLAHADDEDVIDYRTHIMKTMGEQVAIMGMMLEGKIPSDDFVAHARVLAIAAGTAGLSFEPEVPGGDAKPEIWDDWDDFSKRLDELAASTAALADLADDGGIEAAGPKVKEALTCKGCHDDYRLAD